MRGIGLMLAATVVLAIADTASKYLTASNPPAQITWLRYVVFTLCMLPLALAYRARRLRTRRLGLQLARGAIAGLSSLFFVMALAHLPIADTTATTFISPLLVTALSIPLLGEKIGWRRWTATVIGLVGVLIIVRPGGAGFQSTSLLPVAAALAWAFVVIFTRMMRDTEDPVTTLTYTALAGTAVLSLPLPYFWQPLDGVALALAVLVGVTSTIGHWLIISAFRYGDASLLAPFSYAQLLSVTLFGYLVFGALPDMLTFVGAAVIIASSLYTAHREQVRRRLPRPSSDQAGTG